MPVRGEKRAGVAQAGRRCRLMRAPTGTLAAVRKRDSPAPAASICPAFSMSRAGREAPGLRRDCILPRANVTNRRIAPAPGASSPADSPLPRKPAIWRTGNARRAVPADPIPGSRPNSHWWSGYCVSRHCGRPPRVRQRTMGWMMAAGSALAGSRSGAKLRPPDLAIAYRPAASSG